MISLPRLTSRMQLIDPKTGLVTVQAADFWNQIASLLENITAGQTNVAIVDGAQTFSFLQAFAVNPNAPGYDVAGIQVVGPQQPAPPGLSGTSTLGQVIITVNDILTALGAHGLIT